MARDQEDRYRSPLALADDIEHWLADEPVAAYPEPWNQRLSRWARRHRAWTQAAAVSLLVVTAVSVIAAVMVRRERDQKLFAQEQKLSAEIIAQAQQLQAQKQRVIDQVETLVKAAHKPFP